MSMLHTTGDTIKGTKQVSSLWTHMLISHDTFQRGDKGSIPGKQISLQQLGKTSMHINLHKRSHLIQQNYK